MSNLALIKKDTVDVVAQKVREFQEKRELHLPANYSAENAMKSAWLTLQSTVDKDGKPALEVCTKDSIANALLEMVVQGLNPAKKQCYFIVYGKKLVCMRSYFGTMAVTKQVARAKDIYAQVIYKGDEFEYEIKGARKVVTKHVQKLENVANENVIAAYCVIEFDDGREPFSDIMTMDQIRKAWAKSKMNPNDKNSTHMQFTEEMAKKTVINRTCKKYINSSDDNNLMIEYFNRSEETLVEEEVAQEIAENANSEVIDIEAEVTETTQEEPAPEPPTPTAVADNKQGQMSFAANGTEGPGF